jgi:hypothetical protein
VFDHTFGEKTRSLGALTRDDPNARPSQHLQRRGDGGL